MRISELLDILEEKSVDRYRELEVTGLAYDSRLVEPGQSFFCIKGLVTDGHLYAAQAAERGAAILFIERELDEEVGEEVVLVKVPDTRRALALCAARFYGGPSGKMRLIGVTGTNGKTTTTFLIESICREAGYSTGLIGTVENHIGDTVEQVTRTTPESLDLQILLRRMADSGVAVAAMEVSSHALELHRVSGCRFETVAFMNLTQDHLDFHISLEEYFKAKRKLFEGDDFGTGRGAAINIDDPFGRRLLEETDLPCRSFGLSEEADVRAIDVGVLASGNRFLIRYGEITLPVETALQGRFNVYNCLAATASLLEMDIDDESMVRGLEKLQGVPGRFENIDCGQDFNVIVDYAHTPDGIRSLLEACREVAVGRVITVVGCGGDRDRSKRPLMGKVAAELSDICILTSDNPRSEEPMSIIEMILEGVKDRFPPERYAVEADRRKAIYSAIGEAQPGDMVVVAGKGHESGQIFAEEVIPFDDRQAVREGLKEVAGAEC